VRYEVFTAVKIQVKFFGVVMPCSVVVGYQQFRGPVASQSRRTRLEKLHGMGVFQWHNIHTKFCENWSTEV